MSFAYEEKAKKFCLSEDKIRLRRDQFIIYNGNFVVDGKPFSQFPLGNKREGKVLKLQ